MKLCFMSSGIAPSGWGLLVSLRESLFAEPLRKKTRGDDGKEGEVRSCSNCFDFKKNYAKIR